MTIQRLNIKISENDACHTNVILLKQKQSYFPYQYHCKSCQIAYYHFFGTMQISCDILTFYSKNTDGKHT